MEKHLLDPHYSVLKLLENNFNNPNDSMNLSESWQILSSSSENSEEDEQEPFITGSAITVTNPNSSNSNCTSNNGSTFIMPKLIVSQNLWDTNNDNNNNRFLIVGNNSLFFYNEILPINYKKFFKIWCLNKLDSSNLIIIINDHNELFNILQKILLNSNRKSCFNIIIILIIEKFNNLITNRRKIKLIKNSINIINKQFNLKKINFNFFNPSILIIYKNSKLINYNKNFNNFLIFIKNYLSNSKNHTSKDLISANDNIIIPSQLLNKRKRLIKSNKKKKKSKKSKLNSLNKYNQNDDDDDSNSTGKWLFVYYGISITLGVGVGYCISSLVVSQNSNDIQSIVPSTPNNDIIALESQDLNSHNGDDYNWNFLKLSIKNVYSILKRFITTSINLLEYKTLNDSNKIIAMSYVLL
ncbi:hypothetical protein Kpol_2001p73 [Vanderwaltozyma polyspora DSM 70294]|uniref:Uncharacterized protein n=1 Tax=Vanderwaltozyma polyspora (strain ATCC 22028 / DSM 70294 / BCRC 21397 / CBS 2163 / NBRC 10782 / NRRL Y-8283 / UCD 57-17) TaxID=436907 RepID=A7TGV2_VANPO|nr:uncharacterized protein Kpol_2001p73 [Vanderwaltozyma polyspora DSM 70294]EDO18565.1 hypothetical protein Kpol_2001p73 [Vanderwaltozyma polyspora DSM 70294]